ncbi:hypothetical protein ACFL59_04425 [Planctomycetota bacterium]
MRVLHPIDCVRLGYGVVTLSGILLTVCCWHSLAACGRLDREESLKMKRTLCLFVAALLSLGLGTAVLAEEDGSGDITVKLTVASVFELGERGAAFLSGQYSKCEDAPAVEVKSYPSLKSKKPIYGSVTFGAKGSGLTYHYAIDRAAGGGRKYDRLYLDLNLDLDLTNDKPLAAQPSPANAPKHYADTVQDVYFECFSVALKSDSDASSPSVEVVPHLSISKYNNEERARAAFIQKRARRGEATIGGRAYDVFLGHDRRVRAKFDGPGTALFLLPKGGVGNPAHWSGGDRLMAMHELAGRWYSFSASASGHRLTVTPYQGEFGTFKVAAGGRKVESMSAQGSLYTGYRAVAVGSVESRGWLQPTPSCRLPVGDYYPSYLTVTFGRFRISLSYNYHSDGKPSDRGNRRIVRGIKIRKDKPFELDFSNKPAVLFAAPPKGHRLKRGDKLEVQAVLIDPTLGVMIRGLDDTSRMEKETFSGPNGEEYTSERAHSLAPKVLITRADGEVVTEGVMPFG